jgi:hypothetical protein
MDRELARWTATTPASASSSAAPASASSSSATAFRDGASVRTRLAASRTALRAMNSAAFSHSDTAPHDAMSIDAFCAYTSAPAGVAKAPSIPEFRVKPYAGQINRYGAGSFEIVEATANFRRRWDQAAGDRDKLLRVATHLILLSPITYEQIERWYDSNVRVPVALLGERPLRVYKTQSIIFVAPGEELGEIAWTNYDVHLSSNAASKNYMGHASIWMVAIIKDDRRIFLREDVLVCGYKGGENLKPYTKETFNPNAPRATDASVFYIMVPIGSLRGPDAVSKTHDVRGYYRADIVENLTDSARGLVVDKPHYPSALHANTVWPFNGLRVAQNEQADYFKLSAVTHNTITHQSMQWMYNEKDRGWTDYILNTDHFGPNVFEGAGALRTSGKAQHYKDCGYESRPSID